MRFWPPCRILTEERHRYCNLVASLKPIIDEELGMLSELASVEDVMQKLGNVTSNPDEVNLPCILSKIEPTKEVI